MLPVSRNSSTNMMTAMSPSTSGSRDGDGVDAVAVGLRGAGHVDVPACRAGYRVQAVELSFRPVGEQRSRAVDGEERAAGVCPAGADGGPTRLPSTNVPVGADTADTSGTRDRSAAYLSMSMRLTPSVSGTTTVTAASELLTKSRRNWSPT